MRSLNKVFLLGHVGHTPELLTTKAGQPYTRLSIATHRRWKEKEEEKWSESTDWHSVMVWGTLARICTDGIAKGALVFVEGQLSPYSQVREDGTQETKLSIHAKKVSFFNNQSVNRESVA
ncbi:MAG: single-stranded DNA-binding protein [Bdellovibrionales bacterium]